MHRCRKLLEVDFFARCVSKGLLSLSARKWNLGSLAWFLVYTHRVASSVPPPARVALVGAFPSAHGSHTPPLAPCRHARLSIVRRPNGEGYGSLRDDGVISEIERVCEWLMDPISCPTTWPVLLKIRSENNNCAHPPRTSLPIPNLQPFPTLTHASKPWWPWSSAGRGPAVVARGVNCSQVGIV